MNLSMQFWEILFKEKPDEEIKEESKGYVYFILNTVNTYVKIGYTKKHPQKRLKEIQRGMFDELILINFFEVYNAKNIEHSIHKQLTNYKIKGEWYNLRHHIKDNIESLNIPDNLKYVLMDN